MTRVTRYITAAAAVALLITIGLVSTARADYGSGDLGPWEDHPVITTGAPLDTAGALIVGDSITARCWSDLAAWLNSNGGPTLAVNYRSGRPTSDGIEWLGAQPTRPTLTILALGSNDVFNPPAMSSEIPAGLQSVTDPAALVWVDVEVARTTVDAKTQLADQRNSGWINEKLYAALPAAQIVPWSAAIAGAARTGRPGWDYYLADGVHPTTAAGAGKGDGCAYWASTLGPVIKARYSIVTSGGPYPYTQRAPR